MLRVGVVLATTMQIAQLSVVAANRVTTWEMGTDVCGLGKDGKNHPAKYAYPNSDGSDTHHLVLKDGNTHWPKAPGSIISMPPCNPSTEVAIHNPSNQQEMMKHIHDMIPHLMVAKKDTKEKLLEKALEKAMADFVAAVNPASNAAKLEENMALKIMKKLLTARVECHTPADSNWDHVGDLSNCADVDGISKAKRKGYPKMYALLDTAEDKKKFRDMFPILPSEAETQVRLADVLEEYVRNMNQH